MSTGPGKYDDECTLARTSTRGALVILLVVDGAHGSGFSVQSDDPALLAGIPDMLRHMAAVIEQDL